MDYHAPLSQLNEATLVVTVNQRLAQTLARVHQDVQSSQHTVWPAANIIAWSPWLQRLWKQSADARLLLTSFEESLLWQQSLKACSQAHNALSNPKAIVQLAQRAWSDIHQYQIDLASLSNDPNEDVALFCQLADQFQAFCQTKGTISQAQLTEALLPQISQLPELKTIKNIVLLGFEHLTPIQMQLLGGLKDQQITHFALDGDLAETTLCGCEDEHDEWQRMARWAASQLAANPQAQIACVVPDLNQHRKRIERIFKSTFPDVLDYNIAAPPTLDQYPMIQSARLLLNVLCQYHITQDQISALLLSPYLAWSEHAVALALIDARMREQHIAQMPLGQWISLMRHLDCDCDILLGAMDALRGMKKQLPKSALPSDIIDLFQKALLHCGWGGQDIKLEEKFQACLQAFISLDHLNEQYSPKTGLQHLHELLKLTPFQTAAPNRPIQVIGQLEAIGLPFDAMWISGLSESVWPKPLKFNPLLPTQIQRDKEFPRSCYTTETAFAHAHMRAWSKQCRHLIYSYASVDQDGQAQMPSILLRDFPVHDLAREAISSSTQAYEWIDDDFGVPIEPPLQVRGGSALLSEQADCPFKAYAHYRLQANKLEQSEVWLSPAERGSLMHAVLEQLWAQLKSHASLMQKTDDELEALIVSSVTTVLMAFQARHLHAHDQQALNLERQHLTNLMQAWLAYEKSRPPFEVIEQEQKITLDLAGLQLSLRADRVDRIEGDTIVIDYKSRAPSSNGLFDERLSQAQLPLYTLASDQEISGTVYAQVTIEQPLYRGVTEVAELFPGVRSVSKISKEEFSWPELKAHWQAQLTDLAREYLQGYAAITPKESPMACQRCDLQTLCRINDPHCWEVADDAV